MAAKILFLHLSDIHIKSEGDEILRRASHIAATVYQRLPEVDTVMIVLSGDIAWSGINEQYKLAEKFIGEVVEAIQSQARTVRVEIFVCPGNHDCDFALNDDTREAVLSRVATLAGDTPSASLVNTATSVQEKFFSFRDRVSPHKWIPLGRLAWQTSLDINSSKVGIRCLNVAWMSQLNEKQGALVFPANLIAPFSFDKLTGLSVTLLHHPFNWFGQSTYREFQTAVRREVTSSFLDTNTSKTSAKLLM